MVILYPEDTDLAQGNDDTAVVTVNPGALPDADLFNEDEPIQEVVTRHTDASGILEIPVYNQ